MDCLDLYSLSIAASKDLTVSRGRSQRERVGFERSGSAGEMLVTIQNDHSARAYSPIGFPNASLYELERRGARVGFSRAAATVSALV